MSGVPEVPIPGARPCPMVGLGTFTIFGQRGGTDEVEEAVKTAIDVGYRQIDCAFVYQNEESVGKGIRAKINEGKVKREDLFVTTKDGDVCFPKDENDKVIFSDHDYVDTWKGMETLVDAGMVKAIGLSNFNRKQIERVLEVARIRPANIQIEIHPYFSNKKLIEYCRSKGMTITAYAPLGNPKRTWAGSNDPVVFEEPSLQALAKAKDRTIAQICLRFLIQRNIIVVPKSVTPSRIKENFQIFDFELTDDEMKTLWALDRNFRIYAESIAADHKYYPFHDEY